MDYLSPYSRFLADEAATLQLGKEWVANLDAPLVIYLHGDRGAGKTTLLLHIIAEEQKNNPDSICAFCDIEGTLDLDYAKDAIGVDLERLHLIDRESLLKANGIRTYY